MAAACRYRWLRAYRAFAIIGVVIFAIQIYLAVKFFSIDISNQTDLSDKTNHRSLVLSEDGENGGVSARKSKDNFATDDEDNPNEIGSVKKKDVNNDVTKISHNQKNKTSLRLDELDFVPHCEIHTKEAVSAIHRAKTQKCKQHIVNITCASQSGHLYEEHLPNNCPNHDALVRKSLGCFKDEKNYRLLSGYYANYKETNSPDLCLNMCLQGGFSYAGVQYSTECFCGENHPSSASKLADSSCNMKCPGNPRNLCGGYFTMNVYQTGITKFIPQIAALTTDQTTTPARIVFLLTLNGRALRQVRRLIDILYDTKHYFFIHVDARQDYLYRELLHLEKHYPNIRLARKRYVTIWGGASLLEMLLDSMRDLLSFDWEWDFVINLSESDFPVKSVEKLEEFLTANKGRNFVKSHGREVQRFIQKQGLDKTFVECDAHMWRVGDRRLPWGLQVDGGSDWVALDRSFVSYVAAPDKDLLISGLLTVFKHTLLPAESFFHTVLRNSKFCNTYIDNNLHVTNWKRKLGCKCQYKHVVDWCGCSPNDFRTEDWPRLQATEHRQLFFARKFEPIINQAIILQVEQWIRGPMHDKSINIDAYWQSIYHFADLSPLADDGLVTVASSITRHNAKMLFEEGCALIAGSIKEISSYHFVDIFKGNLIFHNAELEGHGSILIETWFKHQHHLQINRSAKLFDRLKVLMVSSEYDQKEQIFRNLMRALGPFSEPSLMYHFVPSVDDPLSTSNITFLWIDAAGNVADISDAFIDEGVVINFIKPSLKMPLLPGVWTVKLLEGKTLVAQTKFLITPLQFMSGSEISPQETVMLHSGSASGYKNFHGHLSLVKPFLLSDAEKITVQLKSDSNAKRHGLDLTEWIDTLVFQFYSILGTCVVSKSDEILHCGKMKIVPCHTTEWSSFASDPKSVLGKAKYDRNINSRNLTVK